MNVRRLSPSRRREDVRTWWSQHLQSRRTSGQTQAAYCRARGLDPKYFILWKRKLLGGRTAAAQDEPQRLVPVLVQSERSSLTPTTPAAEASNLPGAVVAIRLTLGNGMSLSLPVAAGALLAVVRELAAVRC